MAKAKKIVIGVVAVSFLVGSVLFYQVMRNNFFKKPVLSDKAVQQIKESEFNEALKRTAAVDQDFDGISDAEEKRYKTNPLSSDSDEDGLTDFVEIFNLKTDPLKKDTDGNGFMDGYEIRHKLNKNNI
jgi:Bacterial TSP3 repeat